MLLRQVVREEVARFFRDDQWRETMEMLRKGREIDHAHVYCESSIHPGSWARLLDSYFRSIGLPLERKLKLLSHGPGYGNVYYAQPKGMCHFEVFLRYNPDVVVVPMRASGTLTGKTVEYWDRHYMTEYYKRFTFRKMTGQESAEVEAYFQSDAWKKIYAVMVYENERSVHSHCIVETSLSPEEILPIGRRALEQRGWIVDRAISIVFSVNGLDQGKITYLLKVPEVVLELEWEFNSTVVIAPASIPLARITTTDMVDKDLSGINYINLQEDDFAWIANTFPKH